MKYQILFFLFIEMSTSTTLNPRINELLSVSHNPKNPGNVVYMTGDIALSQDKMLAKMKDIQKTTLRDLTTNVRIYYDPKSTSSGTAVREDAEILASYEKFKLANEDCDSMRSSWILRLELDKMEMAARGIDTNKIMLKLQKTHKNAFECIASDTNSQGKMVMRLVFGTDVVKNALSLRFMEDKLLDTVLTGVEGIGRVYLRELNRELAYDPVVGGYAPLKQYVLDVEGTNLLDLATLPDVDPLRSYSNDIHEILEVFGIEAARVALYEEFVEVFASEYINYRHLITLIDTMTYPGHILSVDRHGMSKGDSGVLARSSFEQTSKNLFNAAITGEFDTMKGVSANIMFGQKPPCGTGFVDILVDETKLPEAVQEEEKSVFDMQELEEALEEDIGVCSSANIKMEW
jgi:DNA-directed RNA polymerase II subunit RPB1